jgi:hypothetical protein
MSTYLPPSLSAGLGRRVQLPVWALVIVVGFGALAGAAGVAWLTADRGVPNVVRGTITAVNADVTAIGFTQDGTDREGAGLPLALDYWTDRDGHNVGGRPPVCLTPGSSGQRVELAILDVRGGRHGFGKLVVWVRCLS